MFVKGQSGNPSGRPRSKPVTDELRRLGAAGAFDKIAAMLVQKAIDGDLKAAVEIMNRCEGKISDRMVIDSGNLDLGELLARRAAENHGKRVETEDGDTTDDTTE